MPRVPKSRMRLKTFFSLLLITAWTCLVLLAIQFLLGLLFRWLYQITNISDTVLQTVYTASSYLLTLLVLLFLPKKIIKNYQISRSDLGLTGLPTWIDLGLAPIAFIVYSILATIITNIFSSFSWFNATESQSLGFSTFLYGGDRLLAFFALVLVAPIAEEFIFRGYLYGKLKARSNAIIATIITSLAFALLHGQWNVGVNVFVMSIILCGLREITGTIYSGMLMHIIKNAVAFILLYVVNIGF